MTNPTHMNSVTAAIRDRALSIGFDAIGFAKAKLHNSTRNYLFDFIAKGFHGDMGWLSEQKEKRSDPNKLWPDAKTVIVIGLNYGPSDNPLEWLSHSERGAISVYAQGTDYHNVLKKKLRLLARYVAENFQSEVKLFVDTAPVMEKPLAQMAGIGWQGKHTNLVSKVSGSWLFIGEIFTTLDLAVGKQEIDHCGTCNRCINVCPTNAFPAPYQLDSRRCISYLTIEHKGHIPRELRPLIGNRIFGCDDCLAVCPWNKFATKTTDPNLIAQNELRWPFLAELVRFNDLDFRKYFSGTTIKRLGRNRFIRNVLIAMGNSKKREFIPLIKEQLEDKSPLVRAMAIWALAQLLELKKFKEIRKRSFGAEQDLIVKAEWSFPTQ